MKIEKVSLENCSQATGTVVVIDVLRAFTTASFAFAAGAGDIVLVGTVAEALALRERTPGALAMGEVEGRPIEGFDFSNSPAQFDGLDLAGRRLIQRTTAGTQGAVRSTRADRLLVCGFPCAAVTANYIRQHAPPKVTFVVTGILSGRDGDEDAACADYIAALLRGETPDPTPFVRRVSQSATGRLFLDPAHPELPATDLPYCTTVDHFNFAMPVERQDGLLVVKAVMPMEV